MEWLDFCFCGVVPIHTHWISEVLIPIKGSIIAGFIDTNNTAYYKTLQVGEVMIFLEGMRHQVNVSDTPALAFASLNGANLAIEMVYISLLGGNLHIKILERIKF